jgi:predicted flap endonuclease-1-like 5' DNA nuclease/DNA-binding beta-propeller fold protein YncE
MKLADRWDGSGSPFAGDRTLRLLVVPEGARVLSARVRLEPAGAPGQEPFAERLAVGPDAAQVRHEGGTAASSWAEVDLHGRRTLRALEGSGLDGARLHADLGGGIFVPVTAEGGIGLSAGDAVALADANGSGVAAVPGITAARLRLVRDGGGSPDVVAVQVRSAPSGVTLRLGGDAPFWVHPGEMTGAEETPDFAPLLAIWLAANGRAENGHLAIPVTLHTDALARFRVSVELDVAFEAALAPAVPEATFPFDASTGSVRPPGTPAWAGDLAVRLPAGARVVAGETRMRLRGAFADTRVVPWRGPTGVVDPAQARGRVRISADYAQAQEVPPGAEALIVAVDLLLRPLDRAAELQVDLRADEGGRPAQGTLLPRALRVKVAQGAAADRPVWTTAALPEPFHVDAGRRYWLVAQGVDGDAEWIAYPHEAPAAQALVLTGTPAAPPPPLPGLQSSADGGLSWRSAGALVALFRLRSKPARFTVPLQVEAGEPPATSAEQAEGRKRAIRIPLGRFDPLGRIDFTVDDAPLADALTILARGAGAACPSGEALRDGGFSAWTAEGDALGAAAPVALAEARPVRVAASPDGRWAYALAGRGASLALLRIDVPAGALAGEVALRGAVPTASAACALLVHPDGSRAFVLTQPAGLLGVTIEVVELDTAEVIGRPRVIGGSTPGRMSAPVAVEPGRTEGPGASAPAATAAPTPFAAALSPDGETLYLATIGDLMALDTAALEASGPVLQAAGVMRFRQPLVGTAACMAHSPHGGRLCVGTSTPLGGMLHVLDTGSFDPLAPGPLSLQSFTLPGVPVSAAFTPDGTLAVVALHTAPRQKTGAGVVLVDAERGQVLAVRSKEAVEPFGVAVSPDGARGYVGLRGGLGTVDFARRTLLASPLAGVDGDLVDLALTPQGDRVFSVAATDGGRGLVAVEVGTRRLAEWAATGPVAIGPARGERPRGVVLGSAGAAKPEAAMVSQVVPARAGCRYVFAFDALAQPGSAAVAELFWSGARGEPLDPDRVVLAEADAFGAGGDEGRPLRPHRRWVTPPPGTAGVEVRFRTPAGAVEVAAASLACTADPVVNGDFRLPLWGDDGGWSAGPAARAVVRAEAGGGVRVRAAGPGDAELRQEVDVAPGVPLALRFHARAEAAPDGRVPVLRVAWVDGGGRAAGRSVETAVLAGDFPAHPLRLEPPDGAARAVLSLVVPPRATLYPVSLAVLAAPQVEVPLRFIAECPGELTVSDVHVVYDLGDAAPGAASASSPAAGSAGASSAPAGGTSGGDTGGQGDGAGGDMDGCDCCDDEAPPAARPSPAAGPARTVSLATVRPLAGDRWLRPGAVLHTAVKTAAPAPAPTPAAAADVLEHALAGEVPERIGIDSAAPDTVANAEPEPAPAGPVTITPVLEVKGIGQVRERRLSDAGILTAERLARATPEELLAIDASLTPAAAAALIDNAAERVRESNG